MSVKSRVWTDQEIKAVAELDAEQDREVAKLGINPMSKEASDLWKEKRQTRMFKIFEKDQHDSKTI